MMNFLRSVLLFFTLTALALVPVALASDPSAGEKIGSALSGFAGMIPLNGVTITAILFVYNFVRQKWPTKDPASLIRDVRAVINGLMKLLGKVDEFLDKVFGQNVKQ